MKYFFLIEAILKSLLLLVILTFSFLSQADPCDTTHAGSDVLSSRENDLGKLAEDTLCQSMESVNDRAGLCKCVDKKQSRASIEVQSLYEEKKYLGLGDLLKTQVYDLARDLSALEGNIDLDTHLASTNACNLDNITNLSCGDGVTLDQSFIKKIFGTDLKEVKSEMQEKYRDLLLPAKFRKDKINKEQCFTKKESINLNTENFVSRTKNLDSFAKKKILDVLPFFKTEVLSKISKTQSPMIAISSLIDSNSLPEESSSPLAGLMLFVSEFPALNLIFQSHDSISDFIDEASLFYAKEENSDFYKLLESPKIKDKLSANLQKKCSETFQSFKTVLCEEKEKLQKTSPLNADYFKSWIKPIDNEKKDITEYYANYCEGYPEDANSQSHFDNVVKLLSANLSEVKTFNASMNEREIEFAKFQKTNKNLCEFVLVDKNCLGNCERKTWGKVWEENNCGVETKKEPCSNLTFQKMVAFEKRKKNIQAEAVARENFEKMDGTTAKLAGASAVDPKRVKTGHLDEDALSETAKRFYGGSTESDGKSEKALVEQKLGFSIPALSMERPAVVTAAGSGATAPVVTAAPVATSSGTRVGPAPVAATGSRNNNNNSTAAPAAGSERRAAMDSERGGNSQQNTNSRPVQDSVPAVAQTTVQVASPAVRLPNLPQVQVENPGFGSAPVVAPVVNNKVAPTVNKVEEAPPQDFGQRNFTVSGGAPVVQPQRELKEDPDLQKAKYGNGPYSALAAPGGKGIPISKKEIPLNEKGEAVIDEEGSSEEVAATEESTAQDDNTDTEKNNAEEKVASDEIEGKRGAAGVATSEVSTRARGNVPEAISDSGSGNTTAAVRENRGSANATSSSKNEVNKLKLSLNSLDTTEGAKKVMTIFNTEAKRGGKFSIPLSLTREGGSAEEVELIFAKSQARQGKQVYTLMNPDAHFSFRKLVDNLQKVNPNMILDVYDGAGQDVLKPSYMQDNPNNR